VWFLGRAVPARVQQGGHWVSGPNPSGHYFQTLAQAVSVSLNGGRRVADVHETLQVSGCTDKSRVAKGA
jgi:hypothetical protein